MMIHNVRMYADQNIYYSMEQQQKYYNQVIFNSLNF